LGGEWSCITDGGFLKKTGRKILGMLFLGFREQSRKDVLVILLERAVSTSTSEDREEKKRKGKGVKGWSPWGCRKEEGKTSLPSILVSNERSETRISHREGLGTS